jgi:hypothetical protein
MNPTIAPEPAVTTVEAVSPAAAQPQVTAYDLACHYLLQIDLRDGHALQALVLQLQALYGREVVLQATQFLYRVAWEIQVNTMNATRVLSGQMLQPPPQQLLQDNPLPRPNLDAASAWANRPAEEERPAA